MVDELRQNYKVSIDQMQSLVKKFDILNDPNVVEFTSELNEMLSKSNNAYLGVATRQQLDFRMPIIYEGDLISFRTLK